MIDPGTEAATTTTTILSKILNDLYEFGKGEFKTELSKWNNSRNVKLLAKKVTAFEEVKTIWRRDKKTKLSSFYYPSKILIEGKGSKQIQSLKDLPSNESLVIQGTVGQGKSMFLRHLCIKELSDQSSGRIPVFFELRKLDENTSLKKALFIFLASLGFEIDDNLFDLYAKSGKLVILLDGFDEIGEKLASNVITELEAWAICYPSMQFIITSRPGGEIQKSNHFSVLNLIPLDPSEYKHFLTKIGVKGKTLEHLLKAINDSPHEIRGLVRSPLLLTLLVLVYQSEGVIPNELPEFFKLLFTTVFSRHDRTKPAFSRKHKSGLNESKLENLFEAFCFAVMRSNFSVNLGLDQFKAAFKDAEKFTELNCGLDNFKSDIVKTACLLQEDGLYISFIHKSLLDYYPAAFIKSCTDEQSSKIYNSIRRQWQTWKHVLQFLFYIDRYRFSRYFAIPILEEFLQENGIKDGIVTDEITENYLESMYTSETRFVYVWHSALNAYKLVEFGPYSADEFYFDDDRFHPYYTWRDLDQLQGIDNRFSKTTELVDKVTGQINDRYSIHWKKLLSPYKYNELKQKAANRLIEYSELLNTFKKFIQDELDKANLLSEFDITN